MIHLSEAEHQAIWQEVRKEFPDDEMMQELHYVRRLHQLQTKGLAVAERIAFYQGPERGAAGERKSGDGG
jgi:hypothetical protein